MAQRLYSITGRYDLNRGSIGMGLIPWDAREVTQADIEGEIRSQAGHDTGRAKPRYAVATASGCAAGQAAV